MSQNLPEFIRIPPSGARCPYTGLSRTHIFELLKQQKIRSVLPNGRAHGLRLIHLPSALDFLRSQMEGK